MSKIPIRDLYSSAFLVFHGFDCELALDGRQVVFLFDPRPEIYQTLTSFNSNPELRLLDYLTHLKALRSRMIAARKA